jgi:hypothetical protein
MAIGKHTQSRRSPSTTWDRYANAAGRVIDMRTFGTSVPPREPQQHFGFEPDEVVSADNTASNHLFYLAVADRFFGTVVDRLGAAVRPVAASAEDGIQQLFGDLWEWTSSALLA